MVKEAAVQSVARLQPDFAVVTASEPDLGSSDAGSLQVDDADVVPGGDHGDSGPTDDGNRPVVDESPSLDMETAKDQSLPVTPFTTMKRLPVDHASRMPNIAPIDSEDSESQISESTSQAVPADETELFDEPTESTQQLQVTPFTTNKRVLVDHASRMPTVAPMDAADDTQAEAVAAPISYAAAPSHEPRQISEMEPLEQVSASRDIDSVLLDNSSNADADDALAVPPFTTRKVLDVDHSARVLDATKLDTIATAPLQPMDVDSEDLDDGDALEQSSSRDLAIDSPIDDPVEPCVEKEMLNDRIMPAESLEVDGDDDDETEIAAAIAVQSHEITDALPVTAPFIGLEDHDFRSVRPRDATELSWFGTVPANESKSMMAVTKEEPVMDDESPLLVESSSSAAVDEPIMDQDDDSFVIVEPMNESQSLSDTNELLVAEPSNDEIVMDSKAEPTKEETIPASMDEIESSTITEPMATSRFVDLELPAKLSAVDDAPVASWFTGKIFL